MVAVRVIVAPVVVRIALGIMPMPRVVVPIVAAVARLLVPIAFFLFLLYFLAVLVNFVLIIVMPRNTFFVMPTVVMAIVAAMPIPVAPAVSSVVTVRAVAPMVAAPVAVPGHAHA
jgi:hypothetical protein